ncbi:hypothetical protein GCM10007421_37190 [Halopseudomonas oceani]|jgi:cellulose synthase/poly-beta-1,6-N-acetylglucosamine synthase-like glycosyltransferase|uniref:Uncharacterized protein n=1 Tax=Halopseudomonas oceani TaxID=1708783 RepID=A0A2P4ESK5_9GAMM|nr:hypothetical protein [Halopseudomonas oceani]POB02029.1 hypothetical protein C1949_14360 [Halopseudomonas oceani]GGE59159.1 hypothetical protein GCM10007421_37190 [Halopseudomonas oceani]|tara:strand:- start:5262 stop:5504 length:243 start_codon:yes stop_codon:yes gene_type:complete
MEFMDYLVYVGFALFAVGIIWFYVLAFAQSILWGIGCVLFFPVCLVFLVLYWQRTCMPAIAMFSGVGFIVAATAAGVGLK